MLTTDPEVSAFAEWTKIVVGYCDGSLHQGYRINPISYKNTSLYFRGASNTRAVFSWLIKNKNYANAEKVIISGGSAGAIASYLWGNYAASKVTNPNNVVIVPDSGIFLQYKAYQLDVDVTLIGAQNNFKLANLDEKSPLPLCNLQYPGK